MRRWDQRDGSRYGNFAIHPRHGNLKISPGGSRSLSTSDTLLASLPACFPCSRQEGSRLAARFGRILGFSWIFDFGSSAHGLPVTLEDEIDNTTDLTALTRLLPTTRTQDNTRAPPPSSVLVPSPLHHHLLLDESQTIAKMAEFVRAQIFGTTFEITSRFAAPEPRRSCIDADSV